MAEERIFLYQSITESIKVTIEAYFDGDNFVVEGYDIGKTVSEYWGDSDYEYQTTVLAADVPKLYAALSAAQDDRAALLAALAAKFNTNTCYSEYVKFLEAHGIPSQGFSWS